MPDRTIAQRVTKLEERVGRLEQRRLGHLAQEWQCIPELIEGRLQLTDAQVAKLSSEIGGVKRSLGDLTDKVRSLPRALAELLAKRDKRR